MCVYSINKVYLCQEDNRHKSNMRNIQIYLCMRDIRTKMIIIVDFMFNKSIIEIATEV